VNHGIRLFFRAEGPVIKAQAEGLGNGISPGPPPWRGGSSVLPWDAITGLKAYFIGMVNNPGLRPGLYERPLQGRDFHDCC